MLLRLYLRKNLLYLPTVALTDAGFYRDVEPVQVVGLVDIPLLEQAIKGALARGNPVVSAPPRAAIPKPVVLAYAKVKSWSAFERDALTWLVRREENAYHLSMGRRRIDRGWDHSVVAETLPSAAADDTVARWIIAAILRAIHTSGVNGQASRCDRDIDN